MNKSWTGERLETFIFNENTVEHLHRYAIAIDFIKNKNVLDIASGEGYGSNLLSVHANTVVGVDISEEAINLAVKKYKKNNLKFTVGNAAQIPLPDNSIDVVVSFETLEHHDQHEQMMQEIKRVLREDGILVMSSPDKKYYTDFRKYTNPYHVKELYFPEFKNIINKHFSSAQFYVQNMFKGSVIVPDGISDGISAYEGSYDEIKINSGFYPMYNICIASNMTLPVAGISLFNGFDYYKSETDLLIKDVTDQLKKTWRYKIGDMLLKPISFLRRQSK